MIADWLKIKVDNDWLRIEYTKIKYNDSFIFDVDAKDFIEEILYNAERKHAGVTAILPLHFSK